MRKRQFLGYLGGSSLCFEGVLAQANIMQPFEITLLRDEPLSVTLGLNSCVTGVLSVDTPSISNPLPGFTIGQTLELPYRNELTEISCIKPGTYRGFVREDKTSDGRNPGWRIQLAETKQLAIQIHKGNELEDTRGCILLGVAKSGACSVASSAVAMARLKELHGSSNQRPIVLSVVR